MVLPGNGSLIHGAARKIMNGCLFSQNAVVILSDGLVDLMLKPSNTEMFPLRVCLID